VLRIGNVYPGSIFFHPGSRKSRVDKIPDTDPHQRIQVFLNQKTDTVTSTQKNNIRDVLSGSRIWIFSHPGSRGKKITGIPDPQHCFPTFSIPDPGSKRSQIPDEDPHQRV
jgi:hypothetical protein